MVGINIYETQQWNIEFWNYLLYLYLFPPQVRWGPSNQICIWEKLHGMLVHYININHALLRAG